MEKSFMKKNLRILLNMRSLSVPNKINKATIIIASVSTNPNIFISPRPSLSVISNAINDLKAVWNDVMAGIKDKKKLLQEKEALLLELMFELAHYVKFIANGDENIIRIAGLQVKPVSKKI